MPLGGLLANGLERGDLVLLRCVVWNGRGSGRDSWRLDCKNVHARVTWLNGLSGLEKRRR